MHTLGDKLGAIWDKLRDIWEELIPIVLIGVLIAVLFVFVDLLTVHEIQTHALIVGREAIETQECGVSGGILAVRLDDQTYTMDVTRAEYESSTIGQQIAIRIRVRRLSGLTMGSPRIAKPWEGE